MNLFQTISLARRTKPNYGKELTETGLVWLCIGAGLVWFWSGVLNWVLG